MGTAEDVHRLSSTGPLETRALAMLRSRQQHRKPNPAHKPLEAPSAAVSRTSPGHPEKPCQLPEAKDHTSAVESRAIPRCKQLSTSEVCFLSKQEQESKVLKFPENNG